MKNIYWGLIQFVALGSALSVSPVKAVADDRQKGLEIFKFSNDVEARANTAPETGGDTLEFFEKDKETGCIDAADAGFSNFRDVTEYKLKGFSRSFYAAEWGQGVHGVRLSIIDPLKKADCVLKTFEGDYSITYTAEGGHFKIVTAKLNERNEKIGEEVHTWAPVGQAPVKESPARSPSVPRNP